MQSLLTKYTTTKIKTNLQNDLVQYTLLFRNYQFSHISQLMSQQQTTEAQVHKLDPLYDLNMNEDLAKNHWPKALDLAKKNTEHQSLMVKAMNEQVFNKLKDLKTSSGWTIARAINTGTCYPSSFVGCHAGDLESYDLFKQLFHPVIEGYHKGYKLDGTMKHITDMDSSKIATKLEESALNKIITTRIRVARNLSFFPLNPAGTKQTRLEIADLVEKVVKGFTGDLAGTFYRHTDMTPEQTKDLIDKHYLFRGGDKMQAASGYHADWPHGRGIFVSKDEKFMMWVNQGDHLRIISMQKGGNVQSVFERLSLGVGAVEQGIKKLTDKQNVFMSSPNYGMVTCCPSNLGTCMRGSVHIILPKIIEKLGLEGIDKIAREMNCQARGSSGEHSKVIDRIDISNWRRLGFAENKLVEDMIKCVNLLARKEDEVEHGGSEKVAGCFC